MTMDFHELMNVAASKQQEVMKKAKKVNRYNLDLPAPKKEEKSKPRSEAVQRLIREKEREKHEKVLKEREERERKEKEERKRNQFRIPKKKPELSSVDKQQFIDSLFDDADGDSASSDSNTENKIKDERESKSSSSKNSSHKSRRDKVSNSQREKSHSCRDESDSISNGNDIAKGSSGVSKHTKDISSFSMSSKHQSNSSSSSKHRQEKSSSSSSSKHRHEKPSSSSSSKHRHEKPSSSSSSSKSASSSKSDQKTNSKSSSQMVEKVGDPLTKNHLNPILDRTVQDSLVDEKMRILARLKAIKERTLAAIAKENDGKGKKVKGVKSQQRKSRQDEMNEKAKSVEIVKDIVSSDEEDGDINSMPSALDIMLSERDAKLQKEKIARMAKQAWERATKGSPDHQPKETKHRKHSKLHRHKDRTSSGEKRDRHSKNTVISTSVPKPKKPVIVKHAVNSAPPPMDFKAIMAIAEQKSKEGPKQPSLPDNVKKKKKEEEGKRPMTQEEKDRVARKKTKEYQDWLKFGGKPPPTTSGRHSISEDDDDDDDARSPIPAQQQTEKSSTSKLKSNPPVSKSQVEEMRSGASNSKKPSFMSNHTKTTKSGSSALSSQHSKVPRIPINENVLMCGPDGSDDENGSDDADARTSLNPFDRIMTQVHKKRPTSTQQSGRSAKRMRLDSEEEDEGSDMDDFIDDGDDGEMDYSREIQKMFGYDKKRFRDEDDDLSDMEANFATVMAEEKRSAKLGLKEDLEDIRMEQEELRRKAALKKKMRKAK